MAGVAGRLPSTTVSSAVELPLGVLIPGGGRGSLGCSGWWPPSRRGTTEGGAGSSLLLRDDDADDAGAGRRESGGGGGAGGGGVREFAIRDDVGVVVVVAALVGCCDTFDEGGGGGGAECCESACKANGLADCTWPKGGLEPVADLVGEGSLDVLADRLGGAFLLVLLMLLWVGAVAPAEGALSLPVGA